MKLVLGLLLGLTSCTGKGMVDINSDGITDFVRLKPKAGIEMWLGIEHNQKHTFINNFYFFSKC